MIIDPLMIVNAPNDHDYRIKKKEETEDVKPVLDTNGGNKSELDFKKDRVGEERAITRSGNTGAVYGNRGELRGETSGSGFSGREGLNVDIVV